MAQNPVEKHYKNDDPPTKKDCPKTTCIFFDNMKNFSVDTAGSNYTYFTNGFSNGDDAVVNYNAQGGYLNVNSGVGAGGFTKTWTSTLPDPYGGLDHVKYLVYRNQSYKLPTDGSEVIYSGNMSVEQQFGNVPLSMIEGVTNLASDIRIAAGALNVIDYETWLVFDLFVSNESYYALVERLPFGKPSFGGSLPDYHAYSHTVFLAKRERTSPGTDFDTLSIAFNRKEGMARWMINGVEKFRVNNFGIPLDRTYRLLDHGGPDQVVELKQINVGFGTFTLLDMVNPDKDVSLSQAMVDAGSIAPMLPLLQLGPDYQYVDPTRVDRATGADLQVGQAPYAGRTPYDFLQKTDDASGAHRNFGNGARICVKYLALERSLK